MVEQPGLPHRPRGTTVTIRDVLDRTDLAELMTELVGPPTPGRLPRWRCCHRDHADEHPSVTIVRDRSGTERWRCWSGGHGGTAIDAVIDASGCSVGEAVTRLEHRIGATRVAAARTLAPRPSPSERRFSVAARDYLNRCADLLRTPAGDGARDWLRRRGLTDEVLADNLVGFDPGPRTLARAEGLPTRGGVTYPSFDRHGEPVYVQTRHLDPGARGKYTNPIAAHGAQPLLAHVRTRIDGGPLVVTEGIADALTATTAGLRGVALLSAASANPAIANELVALAGVDGVVLAFDNDPAGRAARRRLTDQLDGRTTVRTLRLPDGHDLTDTYRRNTTCTPAPSTSSTNSLA
ncbi:unannotated protein [freshwater metagenome]|uniref:Unannotated protein n=1 Tax=freshwater metagenome TaxID=449393 RepID=A0A6J6ELM6_9ZZZZ